MAILPRRQPVFTPLCGATDRAKKTNQSVATRRVRRDILRATVFLWSTPRATPRAISGWAALSAAAAASLSPASQADSTFLMKLRMRLMRAPLIIGAGGVATDALLGLRRVGHNSCLSRVWFGAADRSRENCIGLVETGDRAHGPFTGKQRA